jgi:hypothetical protein
MNHLQKPLRGGRHCAYFLSSSRVRMSKRDLVWTSTSFISWPLFANREASCHQDSPCLEARNADGKTQDD